VSKRDTYIITGVALFAIVAGYWILALSPKRQESAKLDKDIAEAHQQLDQAKQEKVEFAKAQLQFPKLYASLGRLGKAVPPDEDVPSLLVQLNHAAAQANVDFKSVELKLDLAEKLAAAAPAAVAPTPPAGGEAGATATASTGTTPAPDATATTAAVPAATFQPLPFQYKFTGSFRDLGKLIHNVTHLVAQRNKEIAVSGRLVTIQGFTMKRGKVTIIATTYMLPADQALLAGASPQGPATTDPAAPQAASAGTATPAPPTAAVTAP
jgi:Tfp pilus assembly protein PilO